MTDCAPITKHHADRGYVICTSGRSGSNLLCQYLSSTGVLGCPLEYFNGSGRRALGYPDFPDEPARQIEWILSAGATPNGIFGIKIFPWQLDLIAQSIRWTKMLPDPRFILLRRRDLLGQAISALRATQTGQWRSTVTAQGSATYDGSQIYQKLKAVAHDYARWDIFFARNGIEPLVIVYEDLLANPQSAVDQVANLFGLQVRALITYQDVDLELQRDLITEEWKLKFRDEYRDCDKLDLL